MPASRKRSALLDTSVVYCGDNLDQLKKLPDACIDLIYIDPPFNSNRDYEVFWGETKEKRAFEDRHESTQAYIEFMRPRCVEMSRVLKKTGSFYYHCDWHASHYVKVMLDQIFGKTISRMRLSGNAALPTAAPTVTVRFMTRFFSTRDQKNTRGTTSTNPTTLSTLKHSSTKASSGVGRADLVFEDRHGRLLIIEVKKGKLPRGAIDQLHDYFGMMKQKYPNKAVEMLVVAWAIPQERRLACEHYDIDCREFSEKFFREIAAEYGYLFASESQIFEKKPESGSSLKGMELIAPATEVMDKVGMSGASVVHDWAEISDKSKVDVAQEAAALPIPSTLQRAVKNVLPDSKTLLLPVLRIFADGVEHTSEEIGERIKVQFQIAPHQLLQKHNDRISVFQNNVALALANLQGAPHKGPKCIEKVRKKVYRITEYGKTVLKRNPSSLTIKDL